MDSKNEPAYVRQRPLANGGVSYSVECRVSGKRRSVSFTSSPAAEVFASVVRYFGGAAALDLLAASNPAPGQDPAGKRKSARAFRLTG